MEQWSTIFRCTHGRVLSPLKSDDFVWWWQAHITAWEVAWVLNISRQFVSWRTGSLLVMSVALSHRKDEPKLKPLEKETHKREGKLKTSKKTCASWMSPNCMNLSREPAHSPGCSTKLLHMQRLFQLWFLTLQCRAPPADRTASGTAAFLWSKLGFYSLKNVVRFAKMILRSSRVVFVQNAGKHPHKTHLAIYVQQITADIVSWDVDSVQKLDGGKKSCAESRIIQFGQSTLKSVEIKIMHAGVAEDKLKSCAAGEPLIHQR